jgi:hypothetical protein
MVAQFSGAHLSVQITRCDPKIAREHYAIVFRIRSIAATVAFNDSRRSVALTENATRFEQEFSPRLYQRTLERSDKQFRTFRIDLGIGGIDHAQDIPCVLKQSMLKAATGSKKWKPLLTSKLDCGQCSLCILVWTRGNTPDALIGFELCFRVLNACGRNPSPMDGNTVVGSSQAKG